MTDSFDRQQVQSGAAETLPRRFANDGAEGPSQQTPAPQADQVRFVGGVWVGSTPVGSVGHRFGGVTLTPPKSPISPDTNVVAS